MACVFKGKNTNDRLNASYTTRSHGTNLLSVVIITPLNYRIRLIFSIFDPSFLSTVQNELFM